MNALSRLKTRLSPDVIDRTEISPESTPAVQEIRYDRRTLFRKLLGVTAYILTALPACTKLLDPEQNINLDQFNFDQNEGSPSPETLGDEQIRYLLKIAFSEIIGRSLNVNELSGLETLLKSREMGGRIDFVHNGQDASFRISREADSDLAKVDFYIYENHVSSTEVRLSDTKLSLDTDWAIQEEYRKESINSESLVFQNRNTFHAVGTTFYSLEDPTMRQAINLKNLLFYLKRNQGEKYELPWAKIPDLRSDRQLKEIYSYFRDDPENFSRFVLSVVWPGEDETEEDEYRHPIDTLSTGWGDCDDYAILAALWAKMHQYPYYYIVILEPKKHVVTVIKKENGETIIFDNGNLHKEVTPEKYVKETYGAKNMIRL